GLERVVHVEDPARRDCAESHSKVGEDTGELLDDLAKNLVGLGAGVDLGGDGRDELEALAALEEAVLGGLVNADVAGDHGGEARGRGGVEIEGGSLRARARER